SMRRPCIAYTREGVRRWWSYPNRRLRLERSGDDGAGAGFVDLPAGDQRMSVTTQLHPLHVAVPVVPGEETRPLDVGHSDIDIAAAVHHPLVLPAPEECRVVRALEESVEVEVVVLVHDFVVHDVRVLIGVGVEVAPTLD